MNNISIVNYGVGNIFSIFNAIEKIGATPSIVNTPKDINNSDRILLPGVGAFSSGMNAIKQLDIYDAINNHANKGKPLLGICLVMQMLLEESSECDGCSGLALLEGSVDKLSDKDIDGTQVVLPQIGWNSIDISRKTPSSDYNILSGIEQESLFYFLHSYYVNNIDKGKTIALTNYYSNTFTSVIQKENIIGVQFHPEKSGESGLSILRNFSHM